MRAPEAPMGWPSAQAPPLTLSLSRSMRQIAHGDHRHHGEGLVDLEEIHLIGAPAGALQGLAHGRDRGGGELRGRVGVDAVAGDAGDGLESQGLGGGGAHEHQGRSAVGDRGGVGGRDRAVLRERRLERRDLGRISLQGLLVLADRLHAFAAGDVHGDDFALEGPALHGRLGAAETFDGIGVHIGAGELIGRRGLLGEGAHELARVIGVLEAIEVHGIHHPVVADAGAAAMFGQQIGGVGHALHAAGDHDFRPSRP